MGVVKEMIIVEERLEEMFNTLPMIQTSNGDFQPIFMYGDQKELNAFLKTSIGSDKPYPLIWLVYPYEENHTRTHVDIQRLSLILAVETNNAMLNPERMENTFKTVLVPLWNNIRHLFNASGTIDVNQEYDIIKFPNYGETDTESESIDVWDALKVTFKCKINNYCLKQIIY